MRCRNTIILLLIFIGSTRLSSQIKTISDRYIGCAPDSFKFYTVGNTHAGQMWNSGNGSTPTIDSPTFVYGTAGTYTITIGGLSKQITIYPKINFGFTTDSIKFGCFPFKFNLRDTTKYPTGVTPTTINWIYQDGGGGIGSPIQSTITNYYNYYCYVNMVVSTNIPSCYGNKKIDSFFRILDVPQAIIDTSSLYSCKVPFTPILTNKSTDSLKTTLTYLWQWDKPTAGSSTSTQIPPLTFTTNTIATITLAATNQFGCKGYDTVKIVIDTPFLQFEASTRVCRSPNQGYLKVMNLDTANFIYIFSSQKSSTGSDIFFQQFNSPIKTDTIRFYAFFSDNQYVDTFAYVYVTKIKKSNPACSTTQKQKVYICQTYPVPEVKFSKQCKPPFVDTIIAHHWSPCWDTIVYSLIYADKYGIAITRNKYRATQVDVIKQLGLDTILYYGLNVLNKTDSFYRRGPLSISLNIDFINAETKCAVNSGTYSGLNTSLFRPHLVNYKNKGCKGVKDSFVIYDYGIGHIDSVIWDFGDGQKAYNRDSIATHIYSNAGFYVARVIVFNGATGCIDTTNTVEVHRADSILPILNISQKNLCNSDTTDISIVNPSLFDRWYFLTDSFKNFNCLNQSQFTWKKFYTTGKQYVYLIAEQDGCITQAKDSIYVKGPKFNLNYQLRCNHRDSFPFYLSDTFGIQGTGFLWDFGDGNTTTSSDTFQGHKYTGDSVDYMVKVSTTNPDGCYYIDSSLIHIRKVKAQFSDTLFCKLINNGVFLNGTPYIFKPYESKNADYINRYNYTWQLQSIKSPYRLYPPWTEQDSIFVDIPEDTMMLTLTARDVNGCEDKITKQIILADNTIDFELEYTSNCPPTQMVKVNNLSTSPWGFSATNWTILWRKNGADTVLIGDGSFNTLFLADASIADTFIIFLELVDKAACRVKTLKKYFIFDIDTSHLIVPDTVCQISKNNIYSTQNDINLFSYRWYINGNPLAAPDTFGSLNYKFANLGSYIIRLDKLNRQTGCLRTFTGKTEVLPAPRLRIDNSYDTVKNKCFPGITTIQYFDSAAIPNLSFHFWHDGTARTLNPSIIDLNKGANETKAIFSTTYGCKDTMLKRDTVYAPKADLLLDKYAICKGEQINFSLINILDVDSVLWSFGDGTIHADTHKVIQHLYTYANVTSDTVSVSFIVYAPKKTCPYFKDDTILIYEAKAKHHLNNKTDTAYCLAPLTIHNTSPKADYYKWDYGDGNTSTNSSNSFGYSYSQAGTYKIKQYAYRSPLGCVDTSFSTIILYPYPKITANADSICLGKKLNINYTDILSNTKVYLTPDSFNGSPYSSSPISTQISKTTQFKLVSLSDKGCKDSTFVSSFVIHPYNEPSLDTIVEMGKRILLPINYNPYWSYTWKPKLIKPSCDNCPNPELQIFDSARYELTIEDYRHCFKNISYYNIRIYPDIVVKVPTAFTPNGDGNNDIIYARGFGIKKLLSFKIFDRQGQLLFMTNDENVGWNGYYKDVLQNTDPYFYTYEAESYIPGKIVQGEGNFMLLR